MYSQNLLKFSLSQDPRRNAVFALLLGDLGYRAIDLLEDALFNMSCLSVVVTVTHLPLQLPFSTSPAPSARPLGMLRVQNRPLNAPPLHSSHQSRSHFRLDLYADPIVDHTDPTAHSQAHSPS